MNWEEDFTERYNAITSPMEGVAPESRDALRTWLLSYFKQVAADEYQRGFDAGVDAS